MPANVDIFEDATSSGKQISPTGELACLKGWAATLTGDSRDTRATLLLNFKSGGSGGTTIFSYEAPVNRGLSTTSHSGSPVQYMNVPGLGLQFDSGIYIDAVLTATAGGGVVDGFLIQTVYT